MYFVMLSLNNGNPTPLVDGDGNPALFETEDDAMDAAVKNPIGDAYPFEVYPWPNY